MSKVDPRIANLDRGAAASLGQTQRQMILGIEHPRITGVRGEEQQLAERDEPRIAPSSTLNNVVNLTEHHVRLREADLLVAHVSVFLRPAFLRFRRHAPRAPSRGWPCSHLRLLTLCV